MTPADRTIVAAPRPLRILIAQTTYLGDLLLTLPLVLRLREQFPESTIAMLVRADLAPVARACPAVNHVHVMAKETGHPTVHGLRALARELRNASYDHVITMPGSMRTAALMVLARIPHRIGWDPGDHLSAEVKAVRFPHAMRQVRDVRRLLAFEAFYRGSAPVRALLPPLFTHELQLHRDVHRAAAVLDALDAFGCAPSTVPSAPWLALPPHARLEVDALLPGLAAGWVVIATGATQPTRRWPVEHMVEVVRLLACAGHTVVIVGTEQERENGERILAEAGAERIHLVAGRASLAATCEIVRRAGAVVANDSAPVHIASAMGTPVIALFGPTLPSFGFGPLSEHSAVIERSGLACRPCTVYGSATCPIGTHECLHAIAPQEVLNAVLAILGQHGAVAQQEGRTP